MTDKKNVSKYVPVFVAIIVTFGGTIGGNYLLVRDMVPEVVAPDRFTGTEGAALETLIRSHLDSHPDRDLDIRVTSLEVKYDTIIKNQDRIIMRLDDL